MSCIWHYVDGSAYCPGCVNSDTPAIDTADATRGPAPVGGRCACCGARSYRIAFVKADGDFDVFETFVADGDGEANAYAEENYEGREWYVLDSAGKNINGGQQ